MSNVINTLEKLGHVEAAIGAMRRVNLLNTKTNKTMRLIEDEYNIKIRRMFKKILDEHKKSFAQIQDLQVKYGKESRGMIRAGIERVYKAGADYAARVANEENVFLSIKDVQIISRLSDKSYDYFWRQITRLIQNFESKIKGEPTAYAAEEYVADPIDASTALLFNTMSTAPLAIATMQKFGQLGDNAPLDMPAPVLKVVFTTKQDEKVCPICGPYDGTEWDQNDPFIIVPVQDTHPRCRCRLLLQTETGELISG